MRKFAVIKEYESKEINLPKRGTTDSAGYDIESAEDVVIPSIWDADVYKGTLVKTGLKVYCNKGEYVSLVSRSSNFNKLGLMLANNIGIIDKDYVDNPENEGHIMFNFINFGMKKVEIKKGERIGQAIFSKYYTTDDDKAEGVRTGGFGSTDTAEKLV